MCGPQPSFSLSPIHHPAAENHQRRLELQGTAAKSFVLPTRTTRLKDRKRLVKCQQRSRQRWACALDPQSGDSQASVPRMASHEISAFALQTWALLRSKMSFLPSLHPPSPPFLLLVKPEASAPPGVSHCTCCSCSHEAPSGRLSQHRVLMRGLCSLEPS